MVKNLPAVQEIGVRSLGQKDPLDKKTAVHPRILAWRNYMDHRAARLGGGGISVLPAPPELSEAFMKMCD